MSLKKRQRRRNKRTKPTRIPGLSDEVQIVEGCEVRRVIDPVASTRAMRKMAEEAAHRGEPVFFADAEGIVCYTPQASEEWGELPKLAKHD